ncbi:MAG: DNA adenine methylase [Prevotella sp.]|nr:DNA adenine methylase [Prevotella sp.]
MKPQSIQLSLFPKEEMGSFATRQNVINVASVPQRSPFRYPGGKTWLVPTARKWFAQAHVGSHLIEPFAGGGIISLTAIAEHFFSHAVMVEMDDDIAATWQTILSDDCQWMIERIASFHVTIENVNEAISHSKEGTKELAFSTIVRNRTNHGGILAKGSGHIKTGENGRGLSSRWYAGTLIKRIREINKMRHCFTFIHGDAFEVMERCLKDEDAFFFIDPPYTVAGRRLYTHYEVDHHRIFELVSQMRGCFLLTYDDTPEVRSWADSFGLPYRTIPMQTTHLVTKEELLISNDFEWLSESPI